MTITSDLRQKKQDDDDALHACDDLNNKRINMYIDEQQIEFVNKFV